MQPRLLQLLLALALLCTLPSCDSEDGDSDGSGAGSSSGGSGANGTGAGSTGASNTGGTGDCPPECFAPNDCVETCGDEPESYGCCPCPEGTINVLSCSDDCGLVGTPCPGATDCGDGLSCVGAVCAPDGGMCASPPGGVGCGADLECLQFAGDQSGICVTPEDQACLCAGDGSASFECP